MRLKPEDTDIEVSGLPSLEIYENGQLVKNPRIDMGPYTAIAQLQSMAHLARIRKHLENQESRGVTHGYPTFTVSTARTRVEFASPQQAVVISNDDRTGHLFFILNSSTPTPCELLPGETAKLSSPQHCFEWVEIWSDTTCSVRIGTGE